jgi:hypothetical protein
MWVLKSLRKLVVGSGDVNTLQNSTYLFIYSLFNKALTTSHYTLTRCERVSQIYVVMIVTWTWAKWQTSSAGSYTWQAHQIRKFTLCFLVPKEIAIISDTSSKDHHTFLIILSVKSLFILDTSSTKQVCHTFKEIITQLFWTSNEYNLNFIWTVSVSDSNRSTCFRTSITPRIHTSPVTNNWKYRQLLATIISPLHPSKLTHRLPPATSLFT